ncbi:MAG: hypothetical protein Hyperionvirus15_55 [Hyperionvirus sp.]|uniref:Aspartic peptidase DDI1-type domain-containing protein n=1 Tax=Hyperionvirus sp. TaxID=2487770 RepID=A0A3G5A9S0_9VIRU|nr:MAG: hypothetical protein Hyperionvirus15_55 [Hyperionvirus sp.]
MSDEDDKELAEAIQLSFQIPEEKLLFVTHLWEMADENIYPMLKSKCQINVNAKIAEKDVTLIIDTGAQVNVMSIELVKKLGIESFMDTRATGKMHGIGIGDVCGQIPYIEIKFGEVLCAANFYILDSKENLDVLIGFPFMMFYKTNLDFEKSQMTIAGHKVNMIIKEF